MEVAKPIIRKIDDTPESLKIFEEDLCSCSDENVQEIITSYPTVYIHNWKESDEYEVYIGESNNVIQRTRQHYETGLYNANSWQNRITGKSAALYIIGHEHFNKSMTLDVENRLMHYMLSVPKVRKVHNLRGNPQNHYYPMEELDRIFSKIWRGLRKDNKDLFPTESMIHDSAIFKASPLHKLTKEQLQARDKIIERVKMALSIGAAGQLIFVEGEAGTGKTVLNSSTFYEICCLAEENGLDDLRCNLIINHDEQITVYEQIAEKLGLTDKYGEVVSKPTRFINTHSPNNPVDIAFVDEAPYETQPKDRPRQCVFGGTSNAMDTLPLDRTGNRRFMPVMVYPDRAECHILKNEELSRKYIEQVWAEAMEIYRSGEFRLMLSRESAEYLKDYQKQFMPEDADAGMILAFLDNFKGDRVCSKMLWKEALHRAYEPKRIELKQICDIMNNSVTDWIMSDGAMHFGVYGKQRGWVRAGFSQGIPDKADNDGFMAVPKQLELEIPFK